MNPTELQQYLSRAQAAQRDGRLPEAARLYRQVVAQAGEQPQALNALGIIALGDAPADAEAWFRRAVAVDTKAPELWMNVARACRAQGDDAGEKAALDNALAIDQRHLMALVRSAEWHERRGDRHAAAERWTGVLAMGAQIEAPSPAFRDLLDHARAAVMAGQAALAEAVDGGLAEARAAVPVQDRRRFDACIDHMLGRRAIYANQPAGLHFPFLPADEFFERRHFPWLERIEAQTAAIRDELAALLADGAPGLAPYVNMPSGTPANKWSGLDGRLDWSAYHFWRNGTRDEAACARCPATVAAVEALPLARIPGRAPTVFFSLLRPGTHLPAHTGVTNARAIIHLPLIVPDGCAFRVGGEMRTWREGEAFGFDDTIEHEAWNRSGQLRAVLIFDTWNPHLSEVERGLLQTLFPLADAHRGDPRTAFGE
ncbi:aspartyl/asparaginyl beta-hydroxylase domain-containing protein [Glacieibacterium sp.]|uniref:aspartyl/asparaginyl beta-hydroxylase domain-containing protein n=1 Tax=Glacieibacterium sp. TaxID=2860237 RepID=UPI003B000AD6